MQIGKLDLFSAWFIQCKFQKLRFDFRGSITLVFKCMVWKENPNDEKCKEKTSHCEKLSQLYKSVCVYGKQNTITKVKFYLGGLK